MSKPRGTYIYIAWNKAYGWYGAPAFTREGALFATRLDSPDKYIVKRFYIPPPKEAKK